MQNQSIIIIKIENTLHYESEHDSVVYSNFHASDNEIGKTGNFEMNISKFSVLMKMVYRKIKTS
jgi:hypothetical protein